MNNHSRLYKEIECYRQAFSYRNIKDECDFLAAVYNETSARRIKKSLELAAGPAEHSFELANRGISATALDIEPQMITYINNRSRKLKNPVTGIHSDMAHFDMSEKFDLAFMMLDSFAYLLTNEAINSHLNSVANALEKEGVYIIEMAHPANYLKPYKLKRQQKMDATEKYKGLAWSVADRSCNVSIEWGSEGSVINYATLLATINTEMEVIDSSNKAVKIIKDSAQQRIIFANELDLHIQVSNRFDLMGRYGGFDINEFFENCNAHRMITVLRKK